MSLGSEGEWFLKAAIEWAGCDGIPPSASCGCGTSAPALDGWRAGERQPVRAEPRRALKDHMILYIMIQHLFIYHVIATTTGFQRSSPEIAKGRRLWRKFA